ncbi:Ig-like domain-containing protein [Flavobacterium sp.]|uniref:Ig-like domain-containing protein n=1 Tax=Flavobacterium sp. TaxID=239 RepID=UPI0025BE907E|nr:Ig-like domain-containing protein [Flavobacterium sp.]
MKNFTKYLALLLLAATIGCAKRGTITGGEKDTIPPTLLQSIPANFSKNFKGQSFKLVFDEYVKMKDVSKNLIISPPMKVEPIIMPSTASKVFTINIKDTLQPNTTYSFNFGQSLQDNNEGNPYSQFKYVFSTGDYIDSLSLGGRIKDAYSLKTDNFVSIMLYKVDSTYNDSIIYKQPPRYITNTLDSLKTWRLENLKEGKYLLIALKDNNNNKFDPKRDKIGFQKEYITIPNDTVYELELFKEDVPFKAMKATLDAGNKLLLGYEGDPTDIKATLKNGQDVLQSVVTKVPDKDSVNIWFKPIKVDSLHLDISRADFKSEYWVKIKAQKKDTLTFKPNVSGTLPLRSKFVLEPSVPLVKFDETKISVTKKDSSAVAFTTKYDEFKREFEIDFPKEPVEKYQIRILPGAFTDFYDAANDSLTYKLSTKSTAEYANIRVTLENVNRFPVMVELTNKNGDVMYSEYSESATVIDFNSVDPALYTLRLIYDDNKNKKWDSGNFLLKRQAEEVIYLPKEFQVRANWDWEQPFTLP